MADNGQTMAEFVIDRSDHISIMAYRDKAKHVPKSVADEINYSGKQVYVAVDDIQQIGQVETLVEKEFGHLPQCAGIAVHHLGDLV